MRLEGLGQLKISTSSGLEPATFRLVLEYILVGIVRKWSSKYIVYDALTIQN
jgi:hypothetical protein